MTELNEKVSEILPCPFCGSDDFFVLIINGGDSPTHVSCNKCNATGPETIISHEVHDVRKAWNDRK